MIVLLRYGKITTFDVKFQVEPFLILTKFQQNQIIIILLKYCDGFWWALRSWKFRNDV